MTQPLALVLYERLLPGTQLVNRLQDLKYRVRAITDASTLVSSAEQEKPMVVLADLVFAKENVCQVIALLKQNEKTRHIPVIAFGPEDEQLLEQARHAGAALIAGETAILSQLSQLLEQALRVE